jgi:hypothetical protein
LRKQRQQALAGWHMIIFSGMEKTPHRVVPSDYSYKHIAIRIA